MSEQHSKSERQREIEQGLRDPSGALIGGLVVLDYLQGHEDYEAGRPPPDGITSVSYDLGRKRAAEKAERRADILRGVEAQQKESHRRVREMLANRPNELAKYDARMRDIESGVSDARSTWHSISPAQRRVVEVLATGRKLVRCS